MAEVTLESLAARLEAMEQKLAQLTASPEVKKREWLKVVGLSEDNEFTRQVLAEIEANSEAERKAALTEADQL